MSQQFRILTLKPSTPLSDTFGTHLANGYLSKGLLTLKSGSECAGKIKLFSIKSKNRKIITALCQSCEANFFGFYEEYFYYLWAILSLQIHFDRTGKDIRTELRNRGGPNLNLAWDYRPRIAFRSNSYDLRTAMVQELSPSSELIMLGQTDESLPTATRKPEHSNPSLAFIGLERKIDDADIILAISQIIVSITNNTSAVIENAGMEFAAKVSHSLKDALVEFGLEFDRTRLTPL